MRDTNDTSSVLVDLRGFTESDEQLAFRLADPFKFGAELGTWVIDKDENGYATLNQVSSKKVAHAKKINVAVNAPPIPQDDITFQMIVMFDGDFSTLSAREGSDDWLYLTRMNADARPLTLTVKPRTDAPTPLLGNVEHKAHRNKTLRLIRMAKGIDDYSADKFYDPDYSPQDRKFSDCLDHVRRKFFDLKIKPNEVFALLDAEVIDREAAKDALRWEAFSHWATQCIEKGKFPEVLTSEVRFPASGQTEVALIRTAEPKGTTPMLQVERLEGVFDHAPVSVLTFLRNISEDWHKGRLSTAQVNLLQDCNFRPSFPRSSVLGFSDAEKLADLIESMRNGERPSSGKVNLWKNLMKRKFREGDLEGQVLVPLFVALGISPSYEEAFMKRERNARAVNRRKIEEETSETASEQPLEASETLQEGSGALSDTSEPKAAPVSAQRSVAPASGVNRPLPFGTSLLGDLTDGASAVRRRTGRNRR